jgi:hypothetical protein
VGVDRILQPGIEAGDEAEEVDRQGHEHRPFSTDGSCRRSRTLDRGAAPAQGDEPAEERPP